MIVEGGFSFRDRAQFEADRYGSDTWVFVRELLQNARDAGARSVNLSGIRSGGRDRVTCCDDGEGMTFDHARRYLFTLYASSKHGRSETAGRFGIGFWSILRYSPDTILVRSRAIGGQAWQVRLDGSLDNFEREPAVMEPGTEVVLVRRSQGRSPEEALRLAVLRDAPFPRCRGREGRPLEVLVNGKRVAGEFELPPPCLSFRRRGLRGVVALGSEPKVEIFAHGLRVRNAATLDELLLGADCRGSAIPATADGLAPRVIIDSRELRVLMARGDAREDQALKRLVSVGSRELRRLVRAELDRHSRLALPARITELVREAWSASWIPRAAAIGILAAIAIGSVGMALRPWIGSLRAPNSPFSTSEGARDLNTQSVAYSDLERRYRGPDVDAVADYQPIVKLRYSPELDQPLFSALLVTGLREDGTPIGDPVDDSRLYRGISCAEDCLEVNIEVNAEVGLLRLPVATGHVVDPESVQLDSELVSVVATVGGAPAIYLDRPRQGHLSYRSSTGKEDENAVGGSWPGLPPEAEGFALTLKDLPTTARALAAADFVRRHVAYDYSPAVLARHVEARRAGLDVFARAWEIGAGDCDVLNSLVVAILNRAQVSARLAIGWIGNDGQVFPGLHAWVEFLDDSQRWSAVDASALDVPESRPSSGGLPVVDTEAFSKVSRIWVLLAVVGIFLAVTGGVAILLGRRAWKRSYQTGGETGLAALLRGAALRPNAFAGVHPLFIRRVVPVLVGRSISLRKVFEKAKNGSLGCGSDHCTLALRAARAGFTVVDLGRSEGHAVAETLGIVDLDRWQRFLDHGRSHPVISRVEKILQSAGEPCQIQLATDVGAVVAVLDGAPLGLGRRARWAVVDEESDMWSDIRNLADEKPALAALLLGDAVIPRVGLAQFAALSCLQDLASEALQERAGSRV